MATLEKIRQRKKILAIVIGLGLLAFIVEVGVEAFGRSFGMSGNVAKVGNEKIDYTTFQQREQLVSDMNQQNEEFTKMDPAIRQQQLLSEMVNEKLLEHEYEQTGIDVSDDEISRLMTGDNFNPNDPNAMNSVWGQLQASVAQFAAQFRMTPADLNKVVSNPTQYNIDQQTYTQIKMQWDNLKDGMVNQLRTLKLQSLVTGALQANDLDRKQMEEDEAYTYYITYVKKEVSSLPDDQFKVTDDELKAEWEKLKPMFKINDEARLVHYIAVPINPSAADLSSAKAVADKAFAALQKGKGIDTLRQVMGSQVYADSVKADADKMAQTLHARVSNIPATATTTATDFIKTANVGDVRRDTTGGTMYVMYKLLNKASSLDSVKMDIVVVNGDKKTQGEVIAKLNAGTPLAEVAKAYPQKVDGQEDVWQQIANAADSVKNPISNAGAEYFVLNSTDKGAQLIRVKEKKAPKIFYTLGVVTHETAASEKTRQDIANKFDTFFNKNKTLSNFVANAAKAGYNVMSDVVSSGTAQLGMNPFTQQGIKGTRKAIKEAFEHKKGDVWMASTDNDDILIAMALDEVYKDYESYNSPRVKEWLTARVRNQKKAEALMKQYNGKANDLAGYASLMGVTQDTTQVVFAQDNTPGLSQEPGLIGRVVAAKQGEVSKMWKGQNGVYVFQVTKTEKSNRKPTKDELTQRYIQTHTAVFQNPQALCAILAKVNPVSNNMVQLF